MARIYKRRKENPLAGSLTSWAAELGVTDKTLRAKLVAAGIVVKAREFIRARDIVGAVNLRGDLEAEKTRDTAAAARIKELKIQSLIGDMLPTRDVEVAWSNAVQSVRQIIWQNSSISESERRAILKTMSEINYPKSTIVQAQEEDEEA